jgi:AcrR family transcriptional regulator
MKTAERILITSLDLFNQQGEGNVSSVDIAIELDISPGNLYYHFKGKEVLVSALFDLYRVQIDKVLAAPYHKELSIEDFFYFLYLVFEQGQLFQFLFHNPSELIEKYPNIGKPFRMQLSTLEKTVEKLLLEFRDNQQINASKVHVLQIVELIGLVFTQSANYYLLKGQNVSDETQLYKSLASILFSVLPYINLEPGELHRLQEAIAKQISTTLVMKDSYVD